MTVVSKSRENTLDLTLFSPSVNRYFIQVGCVNATLICTVPKTYFCAVCECVCGCENVSGCGVSGR